VKDESVRQLVLGVALREEHLFENFVVGRNDAAVAALKSLSTGVTGPLVYLWGESGTGKTHLLEAVCAAAQGVQPAAYVPLSCRDDLAPPILSGLDSASLVCIDDVEAAAGHRAWEEALFHLYNAVEAAGVPLVISAHRPPLATDWHLEDLRSRLAAGTVFQIAPLDDAERARVLEQRALGRGFEFPREAVRYLLHRGPRDMHSLMAILDRLDSLSLTHHRKVTVPLVREALAESDNGS
jgi:DnaA family protein